MIIGVGISRSDVFREIIFSNVLGESATGMSIASRIEINATAPKRNVSMAPNPIPNPTVSFQFAERILLI